MNRTLGLRTIGSGLAVWPRSYSQARSIGVRKMILQTALRLALATDALLVGAYVKQ